MQIEFDYKSLEQAIKKSPQVVAQETKDFLYRGQAQLMRGITHDRWRIGASGGGVPVLSGNLKKSHQIDMQPFSLRIWVDENKANYAGYVHRGTRYMDSRPWLRYAEDKARPQINADAKRLLDNVVTQLGK
jgi:hypothetical protein